MGRDRGRDGGAVQEVVDQIRTAHLRYPALGELSVYVRNNTARRGSLVVGDVAPSDFVVYGAGEEEVEFARLVREAGSRPLVVIAGSYT